MPSMDENLAKDDLVPIRAQILAIFQRIADRNVKASEFPELLNELSQLQRKLPEPRQKYLKHVWRSKRIPEYNELYGRKLELDRKLFYPDAP